MSNWVTSSSGPVPETIVFLNGIAMSVSHWQPFVESLQGRYRCLLHDFRGQLLSLGSTATTPTCRLEDHVEDLNALMDTVGVKRAHVVGTSYGAEVAMMFAAAHPEKTASLVVIDGVSELDPLLKAAVEAWKAAALADPVAFYRGIIPWNYSAAYIEANGDALARRETAVAALPRRYFEAFAGLCDAFLRIDITPSLHRISCPTLVLVGEKDILKHQGFARIIADNVKGSSLFVVPGAGHAAVIELPGEITRRLSTFLDGLRWAGRNPKDEN